jgi:murein DD-endopeptidase MepM/ murein hydrolase activator NlpD
VERTSVPEACSSAWTRLASRALVLLCAVALLAGGGLVAPDVVTATELGDQISSGRRSQAYYESAMLAQDAALARIKAQAHLTHRALKQARRAATQSRHGLRVARHVVAERTRRLADLEALHAGTPVELIPEGYGDRLRSVRRELAMAKHRRVQIGQHLRTSIRQQHARQYRVGALKRQRNAAIARREAAEGGLGAYIVELTRLAELRAENQSDMQLGTSSGFTWPSVGRISQTYGCTGYRLNPRRGSCAHFHDGLDIVAGYGSRVASAADGVVAYAGWNPWDEGGRAWLMVVSHPNGYVTRYGHLLPGAIARVGQFVRQGEAIGRMGNTGHSTGTHLHFELLRDDSSLSPWTYLPAGMVTVKVARHADARAHARSHGKRDGHHVGGPGSSARRAGEHAVDGKPGHAGQERADRRSASHRHGRGDQRRVPADLGAAGSRPARAAPGDTPAAEAASVTPSTLASPELDAVPPAQPAVDGPGDPGAAVCLSPVNPDDEADGRATGRSELGSAAGGSDVSSRMVGTDDPCAALGSTGADAVAADDGTVDLEAALAPASAPERDPGVPQPFRGTSPVPS